MADLFSDVTWFAVMSKPGRQEQARDELKRQGYRVFLPMCRKERRHARKFEFVTRPLFDRYVFVGVDTEQPFAPICSTLGVAAVVRGSGGVPSRVSPLALRAVKRRCDADGGVIDLVPGHRAARWMADQPMRVLEGPFADFVGLLSGVSKETAMIVLDLFGRPTLGRVGKVQSHRMIAAIVTMAR